MNIKRTIAAILAFLALASFAGCKGEKKDNSTSTSAEAAGAQASEAENGSEAARVLQPRRRPLPKRANIPNTILICPGLIGITGRFTKKEICPILRKPLKISQS